MVTGTKESLLELKKLESVCPIKARIIGAGSTKSIEALNRRICWGETGILYQHDPRHVDVLVERLGLENGYTVQAPLIDDVIDENPVWLDSEQIRRYRCHVAGSLFFRQDRADITFAVDELCQRMSDPSQHSLSKLKRLVRYLKGERQWIQVFYVRDYEFRSDGPLGHRLACRQGNAEVVKCQGRTRGTTPFESVHKKTEHRREEQWRGRIVCSSIGSVRSESCLEHDV